MTKTRVNWQR